MLGKVVFAAILLDLSISMTARQVEAQSREDLVDRAVAIMRTTPLIDGHNDLPWAIREHETLDINRFDIALSQPELMTDLPRLREGHVGGQFWVAYSPSSFEHHGAARIGLEQVDLIHRLVERYPDLEFAETADDVMRIFKEGKIASLIGLEGGHMIENSLALLRRYYDEGVRYMTLTHSRNVDWADASTDSLEHGGLTKFGEEVVREMNRLGMLVDLSHVSDSTMWDALRVTEAPVIFSHSSSRHFTPHKRNVPDDVLRAVAENGGIVMVNFVTSFIYRPTYDWYQRRDSIRDELSGKGMDGARVDEEIKKWEAVHPISYPDIGVVADHIEYIRDVAGVDHVGIGSDFDGIESTPTGLEDVSTFPRLIAELLHRGWKEEDVRKVLGLNILRVMRQVEHVASRLRQEREPSVAQIEDLDDLHSEPPWTEPVEANGR